MVRYRLLIVRNILLAFPPFFVTVGLAVVACMEMAGSHPLTIGSPRTIAEAVAMRDGATAMRLLENGEGVDEISMIRRGVLFDRAVFATPLETAVLVDEANIFDFLTSRGTELPREHLACLAADVGARAVRSRLGDSSTCRAGEAWDALVTRP